MTQLSSQKLHRIFVDEYHGERLFNDRLVRELASVGYEIVKYTEAFTYEQLSEFEVYVVWFTRYRSGERAKFTETERGIVRKYIRNGGNAFLIGLGWAWTNFEHKPSIKEYPLNLIAEEYGIFFTASIIDSVAGVHYSEGDVTFSRPFMKEHPITEGVNTIGSPDSAPASLIVSPPAEPLIWGSDETSDADGATRPIVLAAADSGQGKIVCLQHAGYIMYLGYDNFTLLRSIFDWLITPPGSETTDKPKERVEFEKIHPVKQAVIDSEVEPTIGLITALPKELAAAKAMLDKLRSYPVNTRSGKQIYFMGEIPYSDKEYHQIVLALMTNMGTNSAAILSSQLLNHFPTVNDIIMVGIAGGIPNPERPNEHVRLGDVVVSDRYGVIQYDFVKEEIKRTQDRYPPRPPSAHLLSAVRLMEVDDLEGKRPWLNHIDRAMYIPNANRPSDELDRLREFAYPDLAMAVEHPRDPKRISGQPRVYSGTIASANTLLKNPTKRDQLREKFGARAVEMEGSGIADATWSEGVGYLIVRGICDYCDPDKTDDWQEYAAVVAAAYSRGLLESIPV